jgi:formaldehyde-activating enzyme involved in methanogenesis
MAGLFASGHIIDLILGLVVVEALALALWRRRFGTGPSMRVLAPNLASGCCLLLAVRAALVDAWWGWVALALLGSLLAHLADLRGRRHG